MLYVVDDGPGEYRFPGPGFSDQTDRLSFANHKVNMVDRTAYPVESSKLSLKITDLEQWRAIHI
jgi:hypothetical protein